MLSVTVSAYDRPSNLKETLSSLSLCHGLSYTRVFVVCDKSDRTDECVKLAKSHGFDVLVNDDRLGCNETIKRSLLFGLAVAGCDFHIHLEDDTVPSKDALQWFSWARDRYREDKSVFSVSGYQRVPCGRIDQCSKRRWFSSWGWGTWPDRMAEIVECINTESGVSWDILVQSRRGTRHEAFPCVSRIQNTGAIGEHHKNPDWHRMFVEAGATSDSHGGPHLGDFEESVA